MIKCTTFAAYETIALGKQFSRVLAKRDVVVLEGDLGGGKTTFVKGIAQGLNFKKNIISPSFTLMRLYQKKNLKLCHVDLYRLAPKEIFNVGIDDFLYAPNTITVIEWGEKIEKILPRYIKIVFSFVSENSRRIIFSLKNYPHETISLLKHTLTQQHNLCM
jgi:tRNA threonylcarbamoyladenosine biosynthesis protein TsaE